MFCAEDAVLTVLSGLNPALTDDQIREEIMMCFCLAPTRRQALERLRAMHQETDEQMRQYIVRHKVAHLRAHKLTADKQCSIRILVTSKFIWYILAYTYNYFQYWIYWSVT